jgi:hypothetical protein
MSSVTVVVESDDQYRRAARSPATKSSSSGLRLTAWIVIILVFLSGGLALFDLYLLLAGFH